MISEEGSPAQAGGAPAGRHWLSLSNGDAPRRLRCARIVATATSGPVEFHTGDCEAGLVCVQGRAFLVAQDELYEMVPFDALYVPRACDVRVDADGIGCELIEASSPVENDYPVQFIPCDDPRSNATLIGAGVQAGRIFARITFGEPDTAAGEWLGIDVAERKGRLWLRAANQEGLGRSEQR